MDYTEGFSFEPFGIVKMAMLYCSGIEIDEKLHKGNYLEMETFQMWLDEDMYQNCFEYFS